VLFRSVVHWLWKNRDNYSIRFVTRQCLHGYTQHCTRVPALHYSGLHNSPEQPGDGQYSQVCVYINNCIYTEHIDVDFSPTLPSPHLTSGTVTPPQSYKPMENRSTFLANNNICIIKAKQYKGCPRPDSEYRETESSVRKSLCCRVPVLSDNEAACLLPVNMHYTN